MTAVITLTTDFGAAGPFVALMKAVIRRFAPAAPIVDLCHEVAACERAEAAYWIARSHAWFPPGSVHVAVVDPGVGTARGILAASHGGHIFVAPDNGILPMILGADVPLHALATDCPGREAWPRPSMSFHGRDIFAPLAAALYSGRLHPGDIGPRQHQPVPAVVPPPSSSAGVLHGTVVAIDRWGNLISNIDAGLLEGLAAPEIRIGGHRLALSATYGEAAPGALLALLNSLGTLEIACREASAAERLGLRHGAPLSVHPGPRNTPPAG